MTTFIFGLLIAVAGIVTGVIFATQRTSIRKMALLPILGGIVIGAVLSVIGCVAEVPTGHTGVLTTFGRVENVTFDAGLNMKAPWQKVVNMDNRVQKASTALSCFSSDIQEVSIAYTLNYQIDKENAQEIYRTVGISYYDTVIVPNIAEAVKVVTAKYTAEDLVSSRAELAAAIEAALTKSLAKYNIQVVSAAIEDMDFTDAFTAAVEAKQVAAQNKLQAEIEQAQKVMEQEAAAQMAVIQANAAAETAKIQAQAKAETAKIQAEADLEVVKIEADGVEYAGQKEAAANKAIAESITDELLRYQYIQRWDGKLPDTYVGSENVSTIITGAAGSQQDE